MRLHEFGEVTLPTFQEKSPIQTDLLRSLRQADAFLRLPDRASLLAEGSALAKSIKPEGFVPYVIGKEVGKETRYRSSALASCLLYLADASLLSDESVITMRNALFTIRTRMPQYEGDKDQRTQQQRNRNAEDDAAWCVSEGASVWSTSMALIALCHTRPQATRNGANQNNDDDQVMIAAADWLVRQQYLDKIDRGGWAFQDFEGLTPTVPLTSLAIRALVGVLHIDAVAPEQQELFRNAINAGVGFLQRSMVEDVHQAYWRFDGKPSLTATVLAVQAQLGLSAMNGFFWEIPKDKILGFAKTRLPEGSVDDWMPQEIFVQEGTTKYKNDGGKTFYTYMPSLLPPLFEIGLAPTDIRVTRIAQMLISQGGDRWRIKFYSAARPCTFSNAMALHFLIKWATRTQGVICNRFLSSNPTESKCPLKHLSNGACISETGTSGQFQLMVQRATEDSLNAQLTLQRAEEESRQSQLTLLVARSKSRRATFYFLICILETVAAMWMTPFTNAVVMFLLRALVTLGIAGGLVTAIILHYFPIEKWPFLPKPPKRLDK